MPGTHKEPPGFCGRTDFTVAPAACNASRMSTHHWPPLRQQQVLHDSNAGPSQQVHFNFSILSATPAPVLRVVIKGNCIVHSVAIRSADAMKACLAASRGAGCHDEGSGELRHYTGEHIAVRTNGDKRLDKLLPAPVDPFEPPVRTRSLLDQGLCERCRAPASLHFADRLLRVRAARVPFGSRRELRLPEEEIEEIRLRPSLHRWWNATCSATACPDGEGACPADARCLPSSPSTSEPSYLPVPPPLFNLTYAIVFTPRVHGPHLVHVRLEYASQQEALHPTPDDEGAWRGPFVGERAAGSPFRVEVPPSVFLPSQLPPWQTSSSPSTAVEDATGEEDAIASRAPPVRQRAQPKRACAAADLHDLSRAALIAPDESALALPVSRWRYEPLGCTIAPYRVRCSGVARCLARRRLTLMGDSALERLRYAIVESVLPAEGLRQWGLCERGADCDSRWFWSSCWDFNPRFLAAKQTFGGAADLGTSECTEAVRRRRQLKELQRRRRKEGGRTDTGYALRALQPVDERVTPDELHPEKCTGRWSATVRGMLEALVASERAGDGGGGGHGGGEGGSGGSGSSGGSGGDQGAACSEDPVLVLNLAGLHAAAWGNLTMDSWGAALKAALDLATSAFQRVIYITTPTAHPIHYPRLERMPAEFHALNARRTQRVNELERRVLTTFFPSVVPIDAHSLTGLLEDASLKCTDIRHHDFDANRQLMALLLAAVCGDDVE